MRVTVKFSGEKALVGSLGMMNVIGRMKLERAVDHSSAAVLDGAKARVPKRTLELASTLRRKIAASGMSAQIMAGYGVLAHKGKTSTLRSRGVKVNQGKGVYAPAVEFGTDHNPAEPFMHPSLEAEKPNFLANCNAALDATLATAERGV